MYNGVHSIRGMYDCDNRLKKGTGIWWDLHGSILCILWGYWDTSTRFNKLVWLVTVWTRGSTRQYDKHIGNIGKSWQRSGGWGYPISDRSIPVSCKGKNSMIVWYGAFCEETSCNTFAMNYLWLEFVVQKDDPMKTYIRTYSNQPFTSGFITSWISTELENSKSRHLPSISHPLGGGRCWPNELWFDAFLSTIGLL